LHSFRNSTILRPLSGSQAAFANKNGCQRTQNTLALAGRHTPPRHSREARPRHPPHGAARAPAPHR
jgi:hypothetical protein